MKIKWSVILASVLSVAVIPDRGQSMDEVIDVRGCAPGWTLHDVGSDWWCSMDEPGGGGGGGGGGGEGGGENGGGGTGSGDNGPVPTNEIDWAEIQRVWNCGRCKVSAQSCLADAQRAENLCVANSASHARWRCDPIRRDGDQNTVSAWGCSIATHVKGQCSGVEAPFNEAQHWAYTCKTGSHHLHRCTGPGITACVDSWAISHPGASTQTIDTGTLTATFAGGFGGTASKTITATFNVAPRRGYLSACEAAGTVLASGCTSEQQACYSQFSCTASDLGGQ